MSAQAPSPGKDPRINRVYVLPDKVIELAVAEDHPEAGPDRNQPLHVLADFADPSTGAAILHPELLDRILRLEELYGKQLTITSGYRSPDHNKAVGGIPTSLHQYGRAVDLRIHGEDSTKLLWAAGEAHFLASEIVLEGDHLHLELEWSDQWGF